jgi:two-component system OmpR family sensor kinase
LAYDFEISSIKNDKKQNMYNIASKVSSQIIVSFMQGKPCVVGHYEKYTIGLYDKNKKQINDTVLDNIDFTKQFYTSKNGSFLIDLGAQMHHDVKYVVVFEKNSDKINTQIIKNIFTVGLCVLLVIAIVGFVLGKLLLIPLRYERLKLDKFIKDTTHELNTPINALLLSVDLLKNYELPQNTLKRIDISAKKIHNTYSDLTYLLLDTNSKKDIKKINLKNIIEDELNMYSILALKKNITLNQNLEDTFIDIDIQSAKRLISNLISNSIKYTKRDGNISIILQNNSFKISDDGIGIKAADLTKIFNRYYRTNNSTGGFGIGLDIVNRVCKEYGIILDIVSDVGVGTTIILEFL